MVFRILIIVLTILYQNIVFSKTNVNSEFNHRYLSSYFSAMLSYNNYDNEKSLKFFSLSFSNVLSFEPSSTNIN